MVVRVEWEKDASGKYTAKRIKYADDVQGPVAGLAATGAGGTFTVLGQTIKVDALTVFSGVTGLSGTRNGEEVEIEGFVADLSGDTFSVNGVVVSVASLLDSGYENGAKTNLVNNVRVEVEGKITNGVLIAQKVKFKLGGDDGSSGGGGNGGITFGEVKGRVTSVWLPNALSVSGGTQTVTVTVNNDTLFEGGIQRNLGNVTTSDSLKIKFYTKDSTNIATKVERENGND
jgi:hypothetical protein